jgi:hypothetical protein
MIPGTRLTPNGSKTLKGEAATDGASVEGDANSLFGAPNHPASLFELVVFEVQHELVGDVERGVHLKLRARLRSVFDDAIYSAAAELNRSGLEHAATWCCATFAHGIEIRQSPQKIDKAAPSPPSPSRIDTPRPAGRRWRGASGRGAVNEAGR